MSVGGVVLAAGSSARMEREKLLLPFRGRPLLCHALDCMAASPVSNVLCVLGHRSDVVLPILRSYPFPRGIRFLENPHYASGRASSVRLALQSLPEGCEAAVFLPADMPLLRPEDVGTLVERFERTGAWLVVAVDESGVRAHPVLFARPLFPSLAALAGDESGHEIIRERWGVAEKVLVPRSRVLDVDTEEDYRRLLAEGEGGHA
jgi:molybdenum cofactor cytidylyltransferase